MISYRILISHSKLPVIIASFRETQDVNNGRQVWPTRSYTSVIYVNETKMSALNKTSQQRKTHRVRCFIHRWSAPVHQNILVHRCTSPMNKTTQGYGCNEKKMRTQRGHVIMAIRDAVISVVRFCSYTACRTQYDGPSLHQLRFLYDGVNRQQTKANTGTSEWVSSFLTAHQHSIGYTVPYY